jgi:hypothetical protein
MKIGTISDEKILLLSWHIRGTSFLAWQWIVILTKQKHHLRLSTEKASELINSTMLN